MTAQQAHAKTLILNWFDESGQPREMRGKLSSGVDRFFDEIARRDSWLECMTILLGHSESQLFASGRDWRAIHYRAGLGISTVVPGWGYGWQKSFRDKYVYDVLSSIGHYARQYIHRSHVAKILMLAWEREGTILHPFGSQLFSRRYGAHPPSVTSETALSTAVADGMIKWGKAGGVSCSRSRWTRRNTMDPAIHQAVFHFLRGQNLLSSGFGLEAIVAFDCMVQSLQNFRWNAQIGDPQRRRSDLVATLRLRPGDGQLVEEAYFMRNEFAAHAGGWRWWDTGEYAGDEFMENLSGAALRILRKAADAEPLARRVDPEPESWSAWLSENFQVLFPAIWFRANG